MRFALFATIALLLAAPAASAEELKLGWRFQTEYDSEVTSLDGGRDDVIFEFGPTLELSGEQRRLEYEISHNSSYQMHVDVGQLDDWVHETSARARWQATKRVGFTFSERLSVRPQLRTLASDPDATGEEDVLDRIGTNEVLSNTVSLTMRVNPYPRLITSFQVSHLYRTFTDPTIAAQDVNSLTARTTVTYRIREDHTFGGGFRFRRRLFETQNLSQSTTDSYNAFASWAWNVDSRTVLSAQVGPSWASDDFGETPSRNFPVYGLVAGTANVLADANTCDRVVPGPFVDTFVAVLDDSCEGFAGQDPLTPVQAGFNIFLPNSPVFPDAVNRLSRFDTGAQTSDSGVDLYFTFSLTRSWDRVSTTLSWTRSDSETQGVGSATTLDSFVASLQWDASSRTAVIASFRFSRRITDTTLAIERAVILVPSAVFLPGLLPGVTGSPVVGSILEEGRFKSTNDLYSFRLHVTRTVGRHVTAFASFISQLQETSVKGDFEDLLVNPNDFDRWRINVGLNYRFRPIRL